MNMFINTFAVSENVVSSVMTEVTDGDVKNVFLPSASDSI